MKNQNIFFCQISQLIENSDPIFQLIEEQNLFYSYFKVNEIYYLIIFSKEVWDPDFLYKYLTKIGIEVKQLDGKIRRLRSVRGYLLFALDILNADNENKNYKSKLIISTNLSFSFWRDVENIIRQNKKDLLHFYLFGSEADNSLELENVKKKVEALEQEVKDLKEKFDDSPNDIKNSSVPKEKKEKASALKITDTKNLTDEQLIWIVETIESQKYKENNSSIREFLQETGQGQNSLYGKYEIIVKEASFLRNKKVKKARKSYREGARGNNLLE